MSTDLNALLLFCEGAHDTAFVRLVLKKLLGFETKQLKFSEMPSPFNSLFEQAVKKHAAQDMSLDMAHKFFLPDAVLSKSRQIVFLYNCGGKTQYEKIRTLLSDYIPMLNSAKTFTGGAENIVQSVRYLFLYDADAEGINAIADNLTTEFAQIDETQFISETWESSISNFGKISNDKALFVWGSTPEKGTLEDLLLPMFEFSSDYKPIVDSAKQMMNGTFIWHTDHQDAVTSVAETEKYNKAVLTTVGQRKKPGGSVTVILEQSGLISLNALQASQTTSEFVQFIERFLEPTYVSG